MAGIWFGASFSTVKKREDVASGMICRWCPFGGRWRIKERMKYFAGITALFAVLALYAPPVVAVSIDALSQAIATAPPERLPSYYLFRGRAYLAMGDEANGLADLAASLQVRETDEAYLLRGEYYQQRHRLEEAIADYSAALALNAHCVAAYRRRSAAYYDKKEYVQALIDASTVRLYDDNDRFALAMIEKCYVQTSPRERIVLESNVDEVLRARQGLLVAGNGQKSRPSPPVKKVKKVAAAAPAKKDCGPRRRS
jgi:tetratricopeptide (TPR) repeat protein